MRPNQWAFEPNSRHRKPSPCLCALYSTYVVGTCAVSTFCRHVLACQPPITKQRLAMARGNSLDRYNGLPAKLKGLEQTVIP